MFEIPAHRRAPLRGRAPSSSAGRRTGSPARTPTEPRPAAPPPGGSTFLPAAEGPPPGTQGNTGRGVGVRELSLPRRNGRKKVLKPPRESRKHRADVVVFTQSDDCTLLPGVRPLPLRPLRHDVYMSAVYKTLKRKTAGGAVVSARACEM